MRRIPRLRRLPVSLASRPQRPCAAFFQQPIVSVPARAGAPFSTSRIYRDNKPLPRDVESKINEAPTNNGEVATEASAQQETLDQLVEEVEELWGDSYAHGSSTIPLPQAPRDAERPEEVADPRYVAATTSEGLETVGGLRDWWEQDGHWARENEFESFRSRQRIENPALLQVVTRRAIVEALALQKAGREDLLTQMWNEGSWAAMGRALDAKLDGSGLNDAGAELQNLVEGLQFQDDVDADTALNAADEAYYQKTERAKSQPDMPEWAEMTELLPTEQEAQTQLKGWGKSWLGLSLTDPKLKFAVTKRVFQLAGQKIPDNQLASINNVSSFLRVLCKPPKAKKLAEELKNRGELEQLPNVTMYSHRVTPIHKEQMVGRWKIIEKELQKRELPATGSGGYGKFKERDWLRGRA